MDQTILDSVKSSALFRNIDEESLGIMLECLNPRMKKYKQREITFLQQEVDEYLDYYHSKRAHLALNLKTPNEVVSDF